MKTLKSILFTLSIFTFTVCSSSYAQMSPYKFKQQFDKAFSNVLDGNYSDALPVLEKLHENDKEHGQVAFLLGMCQVKVDDVSNGTVEALKIASKKFNQYHQRGLVEDKTSPARAWKYLAVALSDQGKLSSAISAYRNYMSCIPLASIDHKREVMYAIHNLKSRVENPDGVLNSASLATTAK